MPMNMNSSIISNQFENEQSSRIVGSNSIIENISPVRQVINQKKLHKQKTCEVVKITNKLSHPKKEDSESDIEFKEIIVCDYD